MDTGGSQLAKQLRHPRRQGGVGPDRCANTIGLLIGMYTYAGSADSLQSARAQR